jgi:hypothetical protein
LAVSLPSAAAAPNRYHSWFARLDTLASIAFCPTPTWPTAVSIPVSWTSVTVMILSPMLPDRLAVIESVVSICVVMMVLKTAIVEPSLPAPASVSVYSASLRQVWPRLSSTDVTVFDDPSAVAMFLIATATWTKRPTTSAAVGLTEIALSETVSTALPRATGVEKAT